VLLQQLLTGIAGHHIIPCVLASAIIFVFLGLLFGPGRLRRPAHRIIFLYVALLKAGLALWVGEKVSCLARHAEMFGYLGLSLPDLAPDGFAFEADAVATALARSDLAGSVLMVTLGLALGLLCYRWARLAPVYRSIYAARRVEARSSPAVFRIFDELVDRSYPRRGWLRQPRLLIIREAPCPAFTMGIRPPIIVLSEELVETLSKQELKGVIAHELGHVRRLDYVGRWVATILRDIMVWNPFAVLWHSQLLEEQERASDEYAAELVGDPAAVASGLVEVAACVRPLNLLSVGPLTAWDAARSMRRLEGRLARLEEMILRPPRAPKWGAFMLAAGVFIFLGLQPRLSLPIADLYDLVMRAL
jgi:Zn-dependent protease with chaperone function